MAKNLGHQVIGLLEHERVDLRAAAATVLSAIGKGDAAVEEALAERLEDGDGVVRRIALEGLAAMGAQGIAPRLVGILRGDDEALAERAAQVLATQGAAAEAALRKELGSGTVQVRRAMATLLLQRASSAAIEAVMDQLADAEVGEQVLQLLRAEIDRGVEKTIALVEKSAMTRAAAVGKTLRAEWARAVKSAQAGAKKPAKNGAKNGAKKAKKGAAVAAPEPAARVPPAMDPKVAAVVLELGLLLRLIGYRAQPAALPLLIGYVSEDQPRAIRLAAIAAMRRIVATSEAKTTDKAIEILIALASGTDLAVAQSAIDTLRGARVPERES